MHNNLMHTYIVCNIIWSVENVYWYSLICRKLCPLVPVWSNAALQGAVGSGTAHTPASVYSTDTLIPTARFTEQGKLA